MAGWRKEEILTQCLSGQSPANLLSPGWQGSWLWFCGIRECSPRVKQQKKQELREWKTINHVSENDACRAQVRTKFWERNRQKRGKVKQRKRGRDKDIHLESKRRQTDLQNVSVSLERVHQGCIEGRHPRGAGVLCHLVIHTCELRDTAPSVHIHTMQFNHVDMPMIVKLNKIICCLVLLWPAAVQSPQTWSQTFCPVLSCWGGEQYLSCYSAERKTIRTLNMWAWWRYCTTIFVTPISPIRSMNTKKKHV